MISEETAQIAQARAEDAKSGLGLVQVYTGNGKGKSTAALGMALRALGRGLRVAYVQFLRCTNDQGEIAALRQMSGYTYFPLVYESRTESDLEAAINTFFKAQRIIYSGCYDVVILDEINIAMGWRLLSSNLVLEMLKCRPPCVEVVLTGRWCPDDILEYADLVTDMRQMKHPFENGVQARKGIDYRRGVSAPVRGRAIFRWEFILYFGYESNKYSLHNASSWRDSIRWPRRSGTPPW